MTFPTAVKKSGPLTISKTGSGSKTLAPGSPKSPGSPQILSGSSKAPLASKAPEKINAGSSVKKPSVPLKSSTIKNVTKPVVNAKLEAEKTLPSTAKGVIKSVNKPPPLNIKVTDAKGLSSPKTPTKSSIKSQILTKSPLTTTKPALVSKSNVVSTGIVRSPSITKSSQVSITSPMTKASQVTTGIKSSTTSPLPGKSTSPPKSFAVSSPVAKSPPVVSKTSITNATVPKSPTGINKPSTLTLKSVVSTTNKENLTSLKSKEQATVAKPTTPVKKAAILPVKGSIGVKSPTATTNKPPVILKSLSTASSLKSNSLKTPTSPLKLLTKEPPSTAKISTLKSTNKSSVISKSNPTSSKATVNKESSSLSLLSVKSSSTIKSTTSAVSKTLKTNVTPLPSSSITKNLVPKSSVAKTKPLAVVKIPSSPTVKAPVSSIVKTPSSPIVKTSLSIAAKIKTPSPSVKARTSSLSLVKPPLSPTVKKMVPTKLILSPGPSKSKSLSSSRLSSVSTESLASRTSLKSPMTPRSTKVVAKSPSKIIKKTEEPKAKGIRGGQPIKKTIEIPGITELPSNLVSNQQETLQFDFVLENVFESVLKEENNSTITQIPDQDSLDHEKLEIQKMVENINDDLEISNNFVDEESVLSNITNAQNVNSPPEVNEHNLETIEEDSIEPSTPSLNEQKQEDICILSDFEVVKKDECVPSLNNISQSGNNCSIVFDDNYFNTTNENVFIKQLDKTQSCVIDIDDHFEPMNDKLVLGDVPFETDSSQDDISDNEQSVLKEVVEIENRDIERNDCVDDVFIFTDNLLINNFDSVDSTESYIHQFMPKSIKRSEGSSSISTDDGSLLSRKSYSEAVSGSPKDGEYYFDYDFEIVDDCLDYDDEGRSVFVEVTEKEFPELKPKDLSGKRRRNKKQKKRNYSNRTESQSDSNTEINYNPEDFDGNEFCHYIKMMKDCSFYPNGLFSSDSVKLSTSSSLSWLDISIRTTDDDLTPSTENLSTYEVFQASNLNKEFLTSIIGSNESTTTNETTWFWKSIEGKHQPHNKANITLSLQPRPKHLTTPRFMILLALISEAKGYEIKPSLSENFVTKDCMSRFDEKIRRLMVQGFWLIGRLIKESLSEDKEVNCENPFEFVDGDIGLWWAGINMLDWQEHLKECGTQNKNLPNCYQFVIENMGMTRHNTAEAQLVMNAIPDDFMSELDMENFIHTVRNVKYYGGNCFVDSQENLEVLNEVFEVDDEDLIEWEKNSVEKI